MHEHGAADHVRDRATRLFSFLKELAQINSKTVRDVADYEQVVWFCAVPEYKGCFSIFLPGPDRLPESVWLEIRKSPEPRRPEVPRLCLQWVEDDTDSDRLAMPRLRKEIAATDPAFSLHPGDPSYAAPTIRLADCPEVVEEWDRYIEHSWVPWSEAHGIWRASDEIYFKLFSTYQQLKKLGERYELLLGLGLLTWETPSNQIIRRHVVVGDASLTFDANRARFEVQAAPEGLKLHFETEMIEQECLPSLDEQSNLESLLSAVEEAPWSRDEVDKVLRTFIHSISPDGIYSNSIAPPEKAISKPTLTFAPAIILRTRTQRSQIQCLSNIIDQVSSGGHIPSGIEILCQDLGSHEERDETHQTASMGLIDEALYLPLPTNEEQNQIVQRIRTQDGILVQGPPGTGKSHTIANTICHLLAQGKRVLVTSQTPRALRVLKEKIPPEIAPLCVTLLGNDQAARQDLEKSVAGISQRFSDWDAARNQTLTAEMETRLYELRKEKANAHRLLREWRELTTYRHEVAGGDYEGTAQGIATRVAAEESRLGWVTGARSNAKVCPLSNAEFRELLRLCRDLSQAACAELTKKLVSRESIPDLVSFIRIVDDEKQARRDLAELETRCDSLRCHALREVPEEDVRSLREAVSDLVKATTSAKTVFAWTEQAVCDVLTGNSRAWSDMYEFIRGHLVGLREKAATVQTLDIELPEHTHRKRLLTDTLGLVKHLEGGGKRGWSVFAPRIVRQNRYIGKEVRVNGYACTTLERLKLLATYLETIDGIDLLWSSWQGVDQREEGSLLLQVGRLQERLDALEEAVGLERYVALARQRMKVAPALPEPQWHRAEDLEELIADIRTVECQHAVQKVTGIIEHAIQSVRLQESGAESHSLNGEILSALESRDTQALARCMDKMESLEKGGAALSRRDALYERLSKAVPQVAQQLRNDPTDAIWDGRASSFEEAWAWSLADKWVKDFGKEHDEASLEANLTRLSADEGRTVSALAAAKAWRNCLRNLTASRRNNLIAWAVAMKRIGKGTGKRAPIYRKQAQEYMDNCRDAIPAWIMPLYRVFETVKPEPEAFDVVIIDEASQTGPEGLMLGYLGKQFIVVGDVEQIAPEAVGVDRTTVDTLIKKYLDGIPFRGLYGPETSVFHFASILFSGKVVLREHFRCMPEIIQFSNKLCYEDTPLKPLRQYPPRRLEPILLRYIETGHREGPSAYALNRPEADELVEYAVQMCSSREYDGKTIGVISLQGEAQARYIEKKLLATLTPEDLEDRRIVCGDAYAFQGDERDIILLSMVAAPNERIGARTGEADKRRFNVAASRAKDQVVLFHSCRLSDLHPECMRHRLLEYYLHPTRHVYEVDLGKCESQFEKDVCQVIMSKGYRVVPQYNVAGYYIDLVVEGSSSQLAVECDGDRWHGIERYESDVARQRILERCGWRFWRIRGHEYYRNRSGSLQPLWKTLDEMGIVPGDAEEREYIAHGREQDTHVRTGSDTDRVVGTRAKTSLHPAPNEVEESGRIQDGKDAFSLEAKKGQKRQGHDPNRVVESDIYHHSAAHFFGLAHWAKDQGKLTPWERNLMFRIGTYRRHDWQITTKMERQALRIMREATEAGFRGGEHED